MDTENTEPLIEKKYIKRASFLQHKLRTSEVYLPARKEYVRVREIPLNDFDMIDLNTTDENGRRIATKFRARMIMAGVIDEEDNPLFTEEDLDQINVLPASMMNRIVEAITSLSALHRDGLEAEIKN